VPIGCPVCPSRESNVALRKRFECRCFRATGINLVESGVIEDDVQNDADAVLMRGSDQIDQISARAEVRIDIEEVLHTVTVESIEMPVLTENRIQSNSGNTECLQIIEL